MRGYLVSKKQQFVIEHNRLASAKLQVTKSMLSRFRIERASLFKDAEWSIDKLRLPFIRWLTSFSEEDRAKM